MRHFILILSGVSLCVSQNHAQTTPGPNLVLWYSHEVQETDRGFLPSDFNFEATSYTEQELMVPRTTRRKEVIGADASGLPYFETITHQMDAPEQWITPAHRVVLYAGRAVGYDASGRELFSQDLGGLAFESSDPESEGAQLPAVPLLPVFPVRNSQVSAEFERGGGFILDHPDGSFEMIDRHGTLRIFTEKLCITEEEVTEGRQIKTSRYYTPFPPYGFALSVEYEFDRGANTDTSVVLMSKRIYSNHQVWDPGCRFTKTSDLTHLEVFPVPLAGEFRIRLTGLRGETIQKVTVLGYMGEEVAGYPGSRRAEAVLSSEGYPPGPLIISVTTNRGTYQTVVTKN